MLVLVDNGHGAGTPGKRSPDGRLLEWSWTRARAGELVSGLGAAGVESALLVPERRDVPLRARAARVAAACARHGADGVLLVSLHCNAAGAGGRWLQARGWQAHVARRAGADSRRLAGLLAREVGLAVGGDGVTVRQPRPGQPYWEDDFAILRGSPCASVLTENLFMDNRADVALLLDAGFCARLVAGHVAGILAYLGRG